LDGFSLKLAKQIGEYLGDLQEGDTRDTPKG